MLAMGALGLGMIMLIRGGNWTIDSAIHIASLLGISPLIVGFTIVAFGTSLPELIVSVNANMHGAPGIAIGNVLGSNVANILLVVGSTAFFTTIIAIPRTLIRDLMMMMAATILLLFLLQGEEITTLVGFGLVAILLAYVFWQYLLAKRGEIPVEEMEESPFSSTGKALSFLVTGLVFIALGAEFLVRGAQTSAEILGVPDAVIGLSVIAIGTSLPELSTCLIAAARKQTDLLLGNIIGSNVFNIMMIIGVTSAVKPIDLSLVAPQLASIDIWVTLSVSLLFTLLLLFYQKITRFVGILFLSAYVTYIISMYVLSLGL